MQHVSFMCRPVGPCHGFVIGFSVIGLVVAGISPATFADSGLSMAQAGSAVVKQFDFGTADSPVKPGWTRVTSETRYRPQQGYGWAKAAEESFDRTEVHVPGWAKIDQKPAPDPMLRDGVRDKRDLTFRVDVPPGEYRVVVSIGDEGRTVPEMSVKANGVPLAESVTTRTSWGGYATTRTFRRRVRAAEDRIELTFTHQGDSNSVLGCEVISFVPYSVRFADGKWHCVDADPAAKAGLAALNQRDWQKARDAFAGVTDPLLRAQCLAIFADLLDVPEEEARAAAEETVRLAKRIVKAAAGHSGEYVVASELRRVAGNYLRARRFITLAGYSRATRQTGYIYARRLKMAVDLCEQVTEDDPLYDRACLNLGRVYYGYWREGRKSGDKQIADKWFAILKQRQPANRLVRIYTGEQIPWGEEYSAAVKGMPEWAVKQREAMGRLSEVLRWWIDQRQRDNGELGGGYGDDVELLRQWHVYLGGADDPTIRRGWLTLAQGIWTSDVIQRLGYVAKTRDVQHGAEPMADSHPALIGLDYGNPIWVERCMSTMRLMRDLWTGINARGHRHFKSMDFGAKDMKTGKPFGVDVPCNGRASRPGLWLGWYQRNPAVLKLFQEWMDAWVADTLREADGKPAGVVPAAVAFETGRIGGYSKTWYETKPELYWDYFNWPGYVENIYDHMLAVYDWTGDEKYLEPIKAAMELAGEFAGRPVADPAKGSRAWAGHILYGEMARTIEKYRLLTGRTDYDDYLRKQGSAYTRFLLTGDKRHLIEGCEEAASQARFNFELKTSEVLFTDRVSVSQFPMWNMYTGGVGLPYFYPCHFVTWRKTGPHVAVLVSRADSKSLKAIICNFEPEPKHVGMNLWRLEPGTYELRAGPDTDNNDAIDQVTDERTFDVIHRGTAVELKLPAGVPYVAEIRRKAGSAQDAADLTDRADLAIGDQDVFIGKTPEQAARFDGWLRPAEPVLVKQTDHVAVTVVVHNIGRRAANPATVKLLQRQGGVSVEAAVARAPALDAPNDLTPKRAAIELDWRPPGPGQYELTATIESVPPQPEITHRNNRVVVRVRVSP